MARLIDVARAAGVSRSTASNVFNNPDMVRPALRKRVETAARELEYLGPDPKGRLLRDGKFNAIAVLPPSQWGVADCLRNPVFNLFALGVSEACDEVGANLVIVPDREGDSGIRNALVDGFIFGRIEHLREIEPVRLRRLPFAVVDFDAGPHASSVRIDAQAGCYAATKHLIDLGHRRFAIMSFRRTSGTAQLFSAGEPRSPEAAGFAQDQEKLAGYTQAMAEAGIDIGHCSMVQADPWDKSAAAMLLDAAPNATAILSMSVMQGMALVEEARRRGLDVPGDISVVGYNDIPAAEQAPTPLTTVDGMTKEKGLAAGRIVFAGGPPRHEVIRPRLIIRASTGPAPKSSQ